MRAGWSGRLGLQTRVTVAFGATALAVSVVLAVATFMLARAHLFSERETAAAHQAASFAAALQPALAADPDPARALTGLSVPPDSTVLVAEHGTWLSAPAGTGPSMLPPRLRDRVLAGSASRERYRREDSPTLVAAGVPLSDRTGAVFVIVRLSELDQALSAFATTLAGVAAGTTLAAAGAGLWISRLVLHPVRDAAAAAAAVAGGELDTRLPETADRDLRVLAVSFNAMVDTLTRRMARDARFASDVSHELRSPLTALSTSAQVLAARRGTLDARDQQALDVLIGQIDRFQRLVEDLLEISRADAGSGALVLDDVDVAEFVTRAAAGADPHVPVCVDPSARDRRANVDKRRLERVIANLLDNARVHGGGAVCVGVCAERTRIRIWVDDAGPGVAAGDRDRIFERFTRGPAARREHTKGAGLGLALVEEHVRLHGGTVSVEPRPGGGARFVVELPAAR